MSDARVQNPSPSIEGYFRVWRESIARVLGQLHGSEFTAARGEASPSDTSAETGSGATDVVVLCSVSGHFSGEHRFCLAPADALRITHLLMSEPLDSGGDLDDGRKDALLEAFRQFAGVAATAAKAAYGGAVEFTIAFPEAEAQTSPVTDPSASGGSTATVSFSAPSVEPIRMRIVLDAALVAALAQASEKAATAKAAAPSTPPPNATASAPTSFVSSDSSQPNNLNLLLDVTLDAHLRFGQREMLLRDILELRAGSVVELDRRLHEPAELLVSGRVVARGDVVIVDGSYGIRIRDIVQPRDRLESVKP